MSTWRCVVLFLLIYAPVHSLEAKPKITLSDPVPPANQARTIAQRCPGDLCVDDCSFVLSNLTYTIKVDSSIAWRDVGECLVELKDSNGNVIDSVGTIFEGTSGELRPNWAGAKLVACDDTEVLTLTINAQEIEYNVTPQGTNENYSYNQASATFRLRCIGCENTAKAEGSGKTQTEHATINKSVTLACAVINLSDDFHEVNVVMVSESGWFIPPVPPFLLGGGEAMEVFFDVAIPANTVDGTVEVITISSSFAEMPDSLSVATMEIEIDTPMQIRMVDLDGENNPLLQIVGPWEMPIQIQASGDLENWSEVVTVNIPIGVEAAEEMDSGPHGDGLRIYRTVIEVDSP